MTDPTDPVGTGPLSQIAQAVYHHMALGVWLVLGCAPTLVMLTLLAPSPLAVPFFVLAQLPVAPVLSAGLHAVRAWRGEPEEGPFALLWRGLRANTWDVLRWWIPTVLVATVLAVNVWASGTVPGAELLRPVAAAAAALLVLWAGHMLVITTFFSFRTRDAARVGAAMLVVQWRVTLVYISLLVVALGITAFGSDVILALSAWALVSVLEAVSRPVVVDVTARFTRPCDGRRTATTTRPPAR
ncbi:hypothetical protein [Cellulomonas bogoriensis]|uniref:DUF624 domain-containing protein n=1 Tax=Cellulomonas bogoriensis 69B4 = DSM 16987 TaxID=1386082 RepID=A0A0A0BZ16_9CELL|nr:hypothetical protein [Cellulomonas bogoriensis]KGM12942.1 hypothetical protein N869_00470 [Cellulomonas bogoriensis 69B4 = DSM 16987]